VFETANLTQLFITNVRDTGTLPVKNQLKHGGICVFVHTPSLEQLPRNRSFLARFLYPPPTLTWSTIVGEDDDASSQEDFFIES